MSPQERDTFDALLEEIFAELPAFVRAELNEMPVIVEDEPDEKILRLMHLPPHEESDLCGLHSGVPLNERLPTSPAALENSAIRLFRGPIYRLAGGSRTELKEQIRITLLHELGHHFGFTEEELEEMGYG